MRWRKKAKTHIKSTPNDAKLCRIHPEAQRKHPTEDGAILAQLGCDRTTGAPTPPLGPLGPIFRVLTDAALPTSVPRVLSRFSAPRRRFGGRFGAFHEGMKHFPRNPLLPTYRRRHLPDHQGRNTTQETTPCDKKRRAILLFLVLAKFSIGSE